MGAIILGIALFMFLVLIHELGHFLTAKRSGVKVLEFGIGIPPKVGTLWRDKQGTEYTINWIPLGGFVRLKGENPDDTEDFLAPDSFITASLPHKLLVLFAGVIVNALFAWFAFSMAFQQGVYPINVIPDNMIK
jgi:regulator of sigma E protease